MKDDPMRSVTESIEKVRRTLQELVDDFRAQHPDKRDSHHLCQWPKEEHVDGPVITFLHFYALLPNDVYESGQPLSPEEVEARYPFVRISIRFDGKTVLGFDARSASAT